MSFSDIDTITIDIKPDDLDPDYEALDLDESDDMRYLRYLRVQCRGDVYRTPQCYIHARTVTHRYHGCIEIDRHTIEEGIDDCIDALNNQDAVRTILQYVV